MSATLTSSSSCPCLVERAMMPPSITSDAYFASQDIPANLQTEPLEPVIEFRHPSILSVKDDLHDEIARIFSRASKPNPPPFTLPFSSIWDSPSASAPSAASHFFESDGNCTAGSSGTSISSHGSSCRNESFDSLILSPSITNTPTHSTDRRLHSAYGNATLGLASSTGLGLSGLYNYDGTPFDGYGILRPVSGTKEDGQAPHPLVYPYPGYGFGLYGEYHNSWQWEGGGSVLFDADGDTTLVDLRGSSHAHHRDGSQSVDLSRRRTPFSPPGLAKDVFSPDLVRLFGGISGQTAKPNAYTARAASYKSNPSGRSRSTTMTSDTYKSTAPRRISGYIISMRKERRSLLYTTPLAPPTPDVFYTSTPPSSDAPSALSASARRFHFRASQRFQLSKESDDAPSWRLPPVSLKMKKPKL